MRTLLIALLLLPSVGWADWVDDGGGTFNGVINATCCYDGGPKECVKCQEYKKSRRQEFIEKCDYWLDRMEEYIGDKDKHINFSLYSQYASSYCLRAQLEPDHE